MRQNKKVKHYAGANSEEQGANGDETDDLTKDVIDSEDILKDMTFDQLLNLLEYKKEEKKSIKLQLERGHFSETEKSNYIIGYLNKLQALEKELVQRVLVITNTVIRDFSMEHLYHAPTHLKIKEVHYQLLEYQDRMQDLPEEMRGRLRSKVESYSIIDNPIYKDYDKLLDIFFRVAKQDQTVNILDSFNE